MPESGESSLQDNTQWEAVSEQEETGCSVRSQPSQTLGPGHHTADSKANRHCISYSVPTESFLK